MPSASQHRRKAASNRAFLNSVSLDDYPDWVVVAAFYTAVHLIEQLRAARGEGHSEGHEDRQSYVQAVHQSIHTAYHILQNVGWLARYASMADFYNQLQREDVRDRVVGQYLAQIEQYVQAQQPPAAQQGGA